MSLLSDSEHTVRFWEAKRAFFSWHCRGLFVLLQPMNLLEYTYEDPELGRLHLRVNHRARRLTFRVKERELWVTLPVGVGPDEVKRAVEGLRPRLRRMLSSAFRPATIDPAFRIDAPCFRLSMEEGRGTRFLLRREGDGGMRLVYPPGTDWAGEGVQAWLRRVVAEAMRRRAKEVLPLRLEMLARAHGLKFRSVKINASAGRWGSCSARGDINLSLHLVLLPLPLIDYVLLHELAHTREMNHGPRFWKLLDTLTGGRAQELRGELGKHRCAF